MGQVTELWLSCYLVLLSIDSKTRWEDSHSSVTLPILYCPSASEATKWNTHEIGQYQTTKTHQIVKQVHISWSVLNMSANIGKLVQH